MRRGPISVTTISGDDKCAPPARAVLRIEIPITCYNEGIDPGLPAMLEHCFRQWSDGRLPYHVELLADGLRRCLQWAVSRIVEEVMFNKYGNEMVVSEDGRSRTAKWHIEACKLNPEVPWADIEEAKVSIHERQQERGK